MSKFNVHPQKPSVQNSRLEPSKSNEKDARERGSVEATEKSVKIEPFRTPHEVGSSIVRRNEKDDED